MDIFENDIENERTSYIPDIWATFVVLCQEKWIPTSKEDWNVG